MNKWLAALISALIIGSVAWRLMFRPTAQTVPHSAVIVEPSDVQNKDVVSAQGSPPKVIVMTESPNRRPPQAVASQPPSTGVVPVSISPIIRPNPNVKFVERLRAVHALGKTLTETELTVLSAYLLTPYSLAAPDHQSEALLRNDVMNVLVEQDSLPTGLVDLFAEIYNDRQQSVVMRDYALQHLPTIYMRIRDDQRTIAIDALWRGTTEVESTIAGTALLALVDISDQSAALTPGVEIPSIDLTKVRETALAMLNTTDRGELAAITGAAICGRLNIRESLPAIMTIAETSTSVPLRIAAIAALGQLGGVRAEATLLRLAAEDDRRLKVAADLALKRLGRL